MNSLSSLKLKTYQISLYHLSVQVLNIPLEKGRGYLGGVHTTTAWDVRKSRLLLGPRAVISECPVCTATWRQRANADGALAIKLTQGTRKGALVGTSNSHRNRDVAPESRAEPPDTVHNYPSETFPAPPPCRQPPRVVSPPPDARLGCTADLSGGQMTARPRCPPGHAVQILSSSHLREACGKSVLKTPKQNYAY